MSNIPDPSNTSSSNTVVGRDMRSNIILDHNSPRHREVLNPDIDPMSNEYVRNGQTLLGILDNLSGSNGNIDPTSRVIANYMDSWVNNITSENSIHASHLSRLDRTVSSVNESLEGARIQFHKLSVEFSSM